VPRRILRKVRMGDFVIFQYHDDGFIAPAVPLACPGKARRRAATRAIRQPKQTPDQHVEHDGRDAA
jgi:hypothetical protein